MKNLILISLDTVRADVGYSKKFPGINWLCENGISFTNCISSSPLTPVSHATALTGLQPYNHGIRHLFQEKLEKKIKTLPRVLKDEGYTTGAIVSCPGMNSWYGFSEGFDFYDDEIPKLPDGSDPLKTVDVKLRGLALKRANIVVERALKWLEEKKEPFFIFLHFFDAHWPYEAPQKFGGDNVYEEEIAFSDHYLTKFLNQIPKRILNNSLIVCFSDHGEDLGGFYQNDKGSEKLGRPEEFGHGSLLYDQTQKTVFIVVDPSLQKNKIISQQVRLVDLTPTVLDILKIKDIQKRDGISLMPLIEGKNFPQLVGYSETFYPEEKKPKGKEKKKIAYRIDNKYKIIINGSEDSIEFYNLENDPNELKNSIK